MCFCALRKRLSSYLAGITQHPACPYISPVIIAVGRRINANTFAPCMDEFKFTGFISFTSVTIPTCPMVFLERVPVKNTKSPCCKSRRVVYLDSFSKLGTRRTRQTDIQRLKDISSETGTIKSALRIHLPVTVRHSDKLFGFLHDILAGD